MSSTLNQILYTALVAPDDIATVSAINGLRRRLKSSGIDPSSVKITDAKDAKPTNDPVMAMLLAERYRLRAETAEGEVARLKGKISAMEEQEQYLRRSAINASKPRPLRNLTVTEYVTRMTYTPTQADAEKRRIDAARHAGKITTMAASKHKAWVTRRTTKEK